MNKTVLSAFSIFAVIPILVFSMIFPVAALAFSVLKIDTLAMKLPCDFPENSSDALIDSAFSQIPSDGSHPIGDYIEAVGEKDCEKLNELPQIKNLEESLPHDAKPIYASDLSQHGNILINDTDYNVDVDETVTAFAAASESADGPLVLVLHTHATECFAQPDETYAVPDGNGGKNLFYSPSANTTRTTDNSRNVVHLGELFSQKLNELGISTIHCETQHDYPDYNKSYSNSRKSAKEYLEKYPSIKYIVDLHRDSIVRQNGEKIKPLCNINSLDCAQVMLVMGTGSNHPNWRKNLSLALKFKTVAENMYPGFSRPVYLRTWSFNQELCDGSMILEVGSCANSLEEVERAAVHAAEVFAAAING